VWSVVVGGALAVVGLVGVGAFSASLERVVDEPARWGRTWDLGPLDFTLDEQNAFDPNADPEPAMRAVDRDPAVAASALLERATIRLGDLTTSGMSLERRTGDLEIPVVDGRAPTAPDEVALGVQTMRALHVGIGDEIPADPDPEGDAAPPLRVVGRAVLPPVESNDPGEGALFDAGALTARAAGDVSSGYIVRFTPGADVAAAEARIERAGWDVNTYARPHVPVGIANLRAVRAVPVALAAFFGLLGFVSLGHAVAVSTRRRTHDFAVLRTIGFVPGQVRAAIRWQAIVTVLAGAVVGVPLGIVVGRWVWAIVADGVGVTTEVALPFAQLAAALTAVFFAAVAIAWIPSRLAARRSPAVVLRSD
jgi:hypothetical protein